MALAVLDTAFNEVPVKLEAELVIEKVSIFVLVTMVLPP